MTLPEEQNYDPANPESTPTPGPVEISVPNAAPSFAGLAKEVDEPAQDSARPSVRPLADLTRLAAISALAMAIGSADTGSKPKSSPRPQLIVGPAGQGGSDSTERCVPEIAPDGRPVQVGTCTIVFALGPDTIYSARLEDARIMIDSKQYEVEIDYGAVRGISADKHPRFLVRGSKHFLETDMEIKGVVWVEETPEGKLATVKSEEGQVLLQTSWGSNYTLQPGQSQTVALEAPDMPPSGCGVGGVRWKGEKPERNADVWLMILGAMAALRLRRRRN